MSSALSLIAATTTSTASSMSTTLSLSTPEASTASSFDRRLDRVENGSVFALDSVYKELLVQYYKLGLTLIFTVSTFLLLLYLYIVVYFTPKNVGSFKSIMASYVCCCFSATLFATLWKPVMLFPFLVFYPVGWLAPLSRTASVVLGIGIVWVVFLASDCLLLVLLERYFLVCGVTRRKKVDCCQRAAQTFIFLSNVATVVVTYCLCINASSSESTAFEILERHVDGVDRLASQKSLFMLPPMDAGATIAVAVWTFFVSTRVLFLFWMTYNNFIIVGTLTHILDDNSRKGFNLMLKTALVSYATSFVVVIPACALIVCLIAFNDMDMSLRFGDAAFFTSVCVLTSFPGVNVVLLCSTIKHNRDAIARVIGCFTLRPNTVNVSSQQLEPDNADSTPDFGTQINIDENDFVRDDTRSRRNHQYHP